MSLMNGVWAAKATAYDKRWRERVPWSEGLGLHTVSHGVFFSGSCAKPRVFSKVLCTRFLVAFSSLEVFFTSFATDFAGPSRRTRHWSSSLMLYLCRLLFSLLSNSRLLNFAIGVPTRFRLQPTSAFCCGRCPGLRAPDSWRGTRGPS